METYNTKIAIKASSQTLWNILTDFSNAHLWNPEIREVAVDGSDSFGAGTRIEAAIGEKTISALVEQCDAPKYLRLSTIIGPRTGVSEFRLTESDGMTVLEHILRFNTNGGGPLREDELAGFNALWKWIAKNHRPD